MQDIQQVLLITCMAERPRMLVQFTLTGCGPCKQRCTVCLSPCSVASRKMRSCGSMRCPALSGSSGGRGRDRPIDFIFSEDLPGDDRRRAASDDDVDMGCDDARNSSGDDVLRRDDVTG